MCAPKVQADALHWQHRLEVHVSGVWELVTPGQEPYPTSLHFFLLNQDAALEHVHGARYAVELQVGTRSDVVGRPSRRSSASSEPRLDGQCSGATLYLPSIDDGQSGAVVTIIRGLVRRRVAHSSNITNSVCVSKQAPTPPLVMRN